MSKKSDTASALANILKAKRGDESTPPPTAEPTPALPSPALPQNPPPVRGRGGKSSDPTFCQCSVYLRRATRKRVNRALDDEDQGRDFSDLVETLLEQWLASRT